MKTLTLKEGFKKRWKLILKMWNEDYRWLYGLIGFGIGALVTSISMYLPQDVWGTLSWEDFIPEIFGIVITFFGIDTWYRFRAREDRRLTLFRQATSRSNDVALEAVDQIQDEGWWDALLNHYKDDKGEIQLSFIRWAGGVRLSGVNLKNANLLAAHLKDADLSEAHLEGATLSGANLNSAFLFFAHFEGAALGGADLKNTYLSGAHLEGAIMGSAHLEGAIMLGVHLERADLREAHMEGADLREAHLESANLWEAHLEGADLSNSNLRGARNIKTVYFNEKTVLPDAREISDDNGELIYDKFWTPDTIMTRYTDPNNKDKDGNPDFWEPEWVKREREKMR